jgi:hypothetical protein
VSERTKYFVATRKKVLRYSYRNGDEHAEYEQRLPDSVLKPQRKGATGQSANSSPHIRFNDLSYSVYAIHSSASDPTLSFTVKYR